MAGKGYSFDDVRELSDGVLPQGWHHITITNIDKTQSKSGSDMLVFEYTVDVGENALMATKDYIVFMSTNDIGLRKIKTIAGKTGVPLRNCDSLQEIVDMFPFAEQRLRMKIYVEHQYSIQLSETTGWKTVDKAEFDEWDNVKNINPGVKRYRPADEKPTVQVGGGSVDPANNEDDDDVFDLDDDLPF